MKRIQSMTIPVLNDGCSGATLRALRKLAQQNKVDRRIEPSQLRSGVGYLAITRLGSQ